MCVALGTAGVDRQNVLVALAISHRQHRVRFSTAAIDPNVFGITFFLLLMRCVSLWAQWASIGRMFCRISYFTSTPLCAFQHSSHRSKRFWYNYFLVVHAVCVALGTAGVDRQNVLVALAISHRQHCVRFSTAAIDPHVLV